MPSEPVPFIFQLFFYSSVIMTVIASALAVTFYRRAVRRYMNTTDESVPFRPIAAYSFTASVLPNNESARDYAVAEHRLRMRLAQIYGGGIVGVVLVAAWIRFFSGNTVMTRGSIMFSMWREPLGSVGAFALSAALFTAIGIPIIAVVLDWSWRRAAVAFVLYVWIWAAVVFTLIIIFNGIGMADWGSTLILVQIFLISLLAEQPFLLMLVTGSRRIRAVVPMTFAGFLVFFGALIGLMVLKSAIESRLAYLNLFGLSVKSGYVFLAIGSVALILVCRYILRVLANLYETKIFSDRQLLVDCWSVMIILYVFARLGESPGTPELLIALAFGVFCVYRVLIQIALKLFLQKIERPENRCLLLLRTFNFQPQTEKLYDRIVQRWRFYGSVLMIGGPDLATRAINPANYLYFLSRRLQQRFIRSEADLQRNLIKLDTIPDPDGRYRVDEFFCNDQAWCNAVVELLDRAKVVLMDLRGFGPKNKGCIFEIQQLVKLGSHRQIFLVVDESSDLVFLDSIVQEALRLLPKEADKELASELSVLPLMKSSPQAMDAVFATLQGEKPDVFLNDQQGFKNRQWASRLDKLSKPLKVPSFKASHNMADNNRAQLELENTKTQTNVSNLANTVSPLSLNSDWGLRKLTRVLSGLTLIAIAMVVGSSGQSTLIQWYENTNQIYKSASNEIDAHNYFDAAAELQGEGQYDAAISQLKKAIELSPDWPEAHHNLGVNLDHIGDYEAAIAEYRRAAALNPDLAETHYNLGADLDHVGDYDAAMTEYKKALDLDPNHADAYYNRGVGFERQGKYDDAIAEYRKALAVMPKMADAHYNLGVNLHRKGDYSAAIEEMQKTLELEPKNANAHAYLGGLLYQSKHGEAADAAIAEFRKALALNPNLPEVHFNIAVIYFEQSEFGAAITECRKTLDMTSDHVQCHYLIAIALHQIGKGEEAERELLKAQQLNPELKRPWN